MAANCLRRQIYPSLPASLFTLGSLSESMKAGTPYITTIAKGYKNRIVTKDPVPCRGGFTYSVSDGYSMFLLFYDGEGKYLRIYRGWLKGTGEIPDLGQTYIGIALRKNDNSTVADVEALYNAARPQIRRKI